MEQVEGLMAWKGWEGAAIVGVGVLKSEPGSGEATGWNGSHGGVIGHKHKVAEGCEDSILEKRKKHKGLCLKVYLHHHCGQWQQVEREWARAVVQQREEVPRDPRMVAAGASSKGDPGGIRRSENGAEDKGCMTALSYIKISAKTHYRSCVPTLA